MALKVSDIVGSLSTSTSMAAFERMEEKVLKMEAESEAVSGIQLSKCLSSSDAV